MQHYLFEWQQAKGKICMVNIRVWLGHLGSYNAGYLIGRWIDLPKNDEEMNEIYNELMAQAARKGEYGDEFDVFDLEVNIHGVYKDLSRLGLRELNELAERLESMKDYEVEALSLVMQVVDTVPEAIQAIDEGKCLILSDVENLEDLGRRHVEEFNSLEIPEALEFYINYEAYGRQLDLTGWTVLHEAKAAVFVE
jgi:antirestriction protein